MYHKAKYFLRTYFPLAFASIIIPREYDASGIHVRQEDAPEYHGYIVADSSTSFEN